MKTGTGEAIKGALESCKTVTDGAKLTTQNTMAGQLPVILHTTVQTVNSQTSFVLSDPAPADNGAVAGQAVVLLDASSGRSPSVRVITGYTASSKTITIDAAADFVVTAGDTVKAYVTAPGTTAPTAGQVADAVHQKNTADNKSVAGSLAQRVHRLERAMVGKRTHTVSTGVDAIFDDNGSDVIRTMTPTSDEDDLVTVTGS